MLRNMFDIMVHYIRLTYGDIGTVIFQLAMPLLFTFLIGQATSNMGAAPTATAVTWPLAVANEDTGDLGALLVQQLRDDPVLELLSVDAATAVEQIESDSATAVLVIPANFSQQLLANQSVSLDFYSDPEDVRDRQSVEEAIKSSLAQVEGYAQAAVVSHQVADELGLFSQTAVDPEAYRNDALNQAKVAWQDPPTAVRGLQDAPITINSANDITTGIDQSSPGMMAMFATFGMTGAAAVLLQERQWGTLRRLAVMPINKMSIIGGKWLGVVLAGILQMLLLIGAGALLFKVAWGNNPLALLIMVVSFALCVSALGLLLAALVKTIAQANSLGTILVLSISALGGAWWPLEIVPDWLQTVAKLSPISWAMSGFQDIIVRNQGVTAVLPEAAVLLLFTAVFLGIGLWRFKWES